MAHRKITVADICSITQHTRHQIRGLTDKLPGYGDALKTEERVAREYSAHELLVVVICCELESRYGLRRNAVAELVSTIADTLSRPRQVARDPRLVVCITPPSVQYLDDFSAVQEGLVIPLARIFQQVDDYLIPSRTAKSSFQPQLDLGPTLFADSSPEDETGLLIGGRK